MDLRAFLGLPHPVLKGLGNNGLNSGGIGEVKLGELSAGPGSSEDEFRTTPLKDHRRAKLDLFLLKVFSQITPSYDNVQRRTESVGNLALHEIGVNVDLDEETVGEGLTGKNFHVVCVVVVPTTASTLEVSFERWGG